MTAWCVVADSGRLVWSGNRHGRHCRIAVIDLIRCPSKPALCRLQHPFGLPESPDERNADIVRARFHRNTYLKTGISCVHVFFECGISLSISCKALRHRHSPGFAADLEPLDECPVKPDINLMGLTHANDVEVQLASEKNFNLVLAVESKVITDGGATARSEWQILADLFVLNECGRYL